MGETNGDGMDWKSTSGALQPQVERWDGPHYRLFHCGVDYIQEQMPPHRLFLDAMEPEGCWLYVLRGSLRYMFGDNRYRIERGQALVTRRPDPGTMFRSGVNEPVHCLWMHVVGESALHLFDYLHLKYGQIQNLPFDCAAIRQAKHLIKMTRDHPAQSAHFWSEQTFKWMNAWWRCAEENRHEVSHVKLEAVHPSRLLSYAPRTMKNFAQEMGYSRAYLTRKLSNQWGKSPGKVLRQVRLEQAANLLRTTRLTVGEIATMIGYSTTAAFTRAFVRQYQDPPMSYRRAHR
jgi:AraC-like DNA-binding protein